MASTQIGRCDARLAAWRALPRCHGFVVVCPARGMPRRPVSVGKRWTRHHEQRWRVLIKEALAARAKKGSKT